MKLLDSISRTPVHVAFGVRRSAGGPTTVVRTADSISLVSTDGAISELPGATPAMAGVLSAADKSRLDSHPMPTRAKLSESQIGTEIAAVRTMGYLVEGDGGGALYRRVAVEPVHDGKVQAADNSWWEIVAENGQVSARALGVLPDDGSTDQGPALVSACATAMALDATLLVEGQTRVAGISEYEIDVGNSTLRLDGRGARFLFERQGGGTALRFKTERIGDARALGADAPRGAAFIDLADAGGIATGQLLVLEAPGVTPNPARPYAKNCVRRVANVAGNRIHLDQPLFWPFTATETAVEVYPEGRVVMRDIDAFCPNYTCGFSFWRLSDAVIDGGVFEGPDEFDNTTTDMLTLARCDGFIIDRATFRNFRYVNISACRNTRVTRFVADGIRHVDANTWSEQTLIEDGYGVRTETLIQEHDGAIGTTIRRVRDMNTDTSLHGLNMRGIGWTVEDCEAHSTHGVIGVDTCGFVPDAAYQDILDAAVCRLTRFRSSTAKIGNRGNGTLIVEDCDVPGIDIAQSYGTKRLIVDRRTIAPDNSIILLTDANRHEASEAAPIHIGDAVDGWHASGGNRGVAGISQATAAVITTSAPHGMSVGDVFWLAGITAGPTALNNAYYQAASVPSAIEIGIGDIETGAAIDTTGMTAWSAGGNVARQAAAKECAVMPHPSLGWWPALRYSARLYHSTAQLGTTTLTIPVKLAHDQSYRRGDSRTGTITIRVQTSEGAGTAVFGYRSETQLPSVFSTWEASTAFGGTAPTVSLSGAAPHFWAQMSSEKTDPSLGSQQYAFFNLVIGVADPTVVVRQVLMEVEEVSTARQ